MLRILIGYASTTTPSDASDPSIDMTAEPVRFQMLPGTSSMVWSCPLKRERPPELLQTRVQPNASPFTGVRSRRELSKSKNQSEPSTGPIAQPELYGQADSAPINRRIITINKIVPIASPFLKYGSSRRGILDIVMSSRTHVSGNQVALPLSRKRPVD